MLNKILCVCNAWVNSPADHSTLKGTHLAWGFCPWPCRWNKTVVKDFRKLLNEYWTLESFNDFIPQPQIGEFRLKNSFYLQPSEKNNNNVANIVSKAHGVVNPTARQRRRHLQQFRQRTGVSRLGWPRSAVWAKPEAPLQLRHIGGFWCNQMHPLCWVSQKQSVLP